MLQSVLKYRLLEEMIGSVRKNPDTYVVLVVDKHTSKIISSVARLYDIMDAGVLVLESLAVKRERMPEFQAVYFIDNTLASIQAVCNDFAHESPQYAAAHLFFTGRVDNEGMRLIKSCPFLLKHLKGFTELNIDFVAREKSLFTLGRDIAPVVSNLYLKSDQELNAELRRTTQQLVSLCMTLNENPYIRYAAQSPKNICKKLADSLEAQLKQTTESLKDSWQAADTRPRGTLLIVDRALDPLAPLMHEYTYQAMVNDLLKVSGHSQQICKMPTELEGESTCVLSEEDKLWEEFKHQHIGEVMLGVTEQFRQFTSSSKVVAYKKKQDGAATLQEMVQATKDMPKYKAMMKEYHKHMSLAQECMRKYQKKKLDALGELEQDMATGLTSENSKVDVKKVKTSLLDFCIAENIGVVEKLRLLMIYMISQSGISDSDRNVLMRTIDEDLQKAIFQLTGFGVDLSQMESARAKHSKARLAEFQKQNETISLTLMRYLPLLQSVATELANGSLPPEAYPFTSPPPLDAGKDKPKKTQRPRNWRGKQKEEDKVDNRPIFIIFVLGGITFSEVRSLYEVAAKQNVNLIFGSTDTITAKEFIKGLSGLSNRQYNQALRRSKDKKNADYSDISADEGAHGDDDEAVTVGIES